MREFELNYFLEVRIDFNNKINNLKSFKTKMRIGRKMEFFYYIPTR